MEKLTKICVIADSLKQADYLTAAASSLGTYTTVFCYGSDPVRGADKTVLINPESGSFACSIRQVAEYVAAEAPDVVLTGTSANGRLAAGIVAAKLKAGIITDVSELTFDNGQITSARIVYGGAAIKKERIISHCAVICLGEGVISNEIKDCNTSVNAMDTVPDGIRLIERHVSEVKKVNLSAAKNIVAVGRGAANNEALELAGKFAAILNAEIGCTRPVAEEEKLMPKETYIGVSGAMLKPELYLGLGISGQIQHMVGINSATTIGAINKDKNAPIFGSCDFGLVADLNEAIPLILKELS